MYTKNRYSRIFGNTSRHPYIVGINSPENWGTGVLISTNSVLTCAHICCLEGFEGRQNSIEIITSGGIIKGSIIKFDGPSDLALIELAETVSFSTVCLADQGLTSGTQVVAFGVQKRPGYADQLVVAETAMKCLTINSWDSNILDIQLEGGVPGGYSGGPVFSQQGEDARCVGLLYLGGSMASASRAIGLGRIAPFIASPGIEGTEQKTIAGVRANL